MQIGTATDPDVATVCELFFYGSNAELFRFQDVSAP